MAGTVVAVMAGLVGWMMVLRRETFAGHTLSMMAFPGASGAALAGLPTALGYYLACGIAALTIGRALAFCTAGFVLFGCGIKGPLKMPPDSKSVILAILSLLLLYKNALQSGKPRMQRNLMSITVAGTPRKWRRVTVRTLLK